MFSNNKGMSSRHIAATNTNKGLDKVTDKIVYILHAVGAKRCQNILLETECTNGCAWNKEYNGLPPQQPMSMPVCIIPIKCILYTITNIKYDYLFLKIFLELYIVKCLYLILVVYNVYTNLTFYFKCSNQYNFLYR